MPQISMIDLMAKLNRVGDFIFLHFFGAHFDHVDEVLGAGDHDIHVAVFNLLERRVDDKLPIDAPDAHVGYRRDERNIANADRRRCRHARQNIRIIHQVIGETVEVNLHLIHESLWKQRAQRAIDQPRGKNFAIGRPPFALHEPAGKLARSRAAFAVVHLQWKEIDPLARVGANHRAEDDRIAILHRHRAVRQFRVRAGFYGKGTTADLAFNSNCLHLKNVLAAPRMRDFRPQMDRGRDGFAIVDLRFANELNRKSQIAN